MTRLIVTADGANGLRDSGRADLVIPIERRLVWGPLPSEAELAAFLAAGTTQPAGEHWLDCVSQRSLEPFGFEDLAVIELFERCETVELWMETCPNDQLVLIWLLDHLRRQRAVTGNITLRLIDSSLGDALPHELARWKFPGVNLTDDHLEMATLAWQAYRSPTPVACFDLLNKDLSILPQLRRSIQELLEELPGRKTGLGASEMRILELISTGFQHPFDVFPTYGQRFQRRVFGYWEAGSLLESLALAPAPAVAGLADWPSPIETRNLRDRYERYLKSRLSLTPLGKALLVGADDFSRHNPIHRWWGGTELTNDRLWRWDPVLIPP